MSVFWALAALFEASHALGAPPAWELIEDSAGLKIYEQEVPGTSVVAFRGIGEVDASVRKVASVLLDQKHATEWVDSLEEIHTVSRSTPWDFVQYSHVRTPLVLKDRDFVTHVRVAVDPVAQSVRVQSQSIDDPESPVTTYVRGHVIKADFTIEPVSGAGEASGGRCRVTAEVQVDPMGSVPKWIVNLFQRSWPRKAFAGIRRQASVTSRPFPEMLRETLGLLR